MPNALFAIGNALVDQEFKITERFLTSNNLVKGTMQLADSQTQRTLLNALSANLTPQAKAGGGSAANTAFAFASLGGQAYYACRVANDDLGHFYLSNLAHARVATTALAQDHTTQESTGTCVVMVTPDGERTMQTHLGASSQLNNTNIDIQHFNVANYFYIEGYLATNPSACHAVVELSSLARAQGKTIALTLSDPAMVNYAYDGLLTLIGKGVDIIFCNKDEACAFTRVDNLQQAILALNAFSPLVVVTCGAEGAWIGDFSKGKSNVFHTPAAKVDTVLDTNGAGDAFSGCFLYGLSISLPLEICALLANTVAARVIAQFGPRLAPETYIDTLQSILHT